MKLPIKYAQEFLVEYEQNQFNAFMDEIFATKILRGHC